MVEVSTVPLRRPLKSQQTIDNLGHPSGHCEELRNPSWGARKMEGRVQNVTDGCPDDQD